MRLSALPIVAVTVLVVGLPVSAATLPRRYEVVPVLGQDCELLAGGTITTDGTLGDLPFETILGADFTTSSLLGTFDFTGDDLYVFLNITATETQILIEYEYEEYSEIQFRKAYQPGFDVVASLWVHFPDDITVWRRGWHDPSGGDAAEYAELVITMDLVIATNGIEIPEPGTMALLLTGAAGTLFWVWRRRKRTN